MGELRAEGATAHRFTAFVHTRHFAAPGVELMQTALPLEQPLARIGWEQAALPLHLRRLQPDLVHGLMNVLPLATRAPGVVTVHDLAFVRTPEKLPPLKRAYLTRLCRWSVARARPRDRREPADGGGRGALLRCARGQGDGGAQRGGAGLHPGSPAAAAAFRARKGLPARYLLYLGTLEPRKNLELLLRAFAAWRAQAPAADQEVKLVLAGGQGWYYATIFAQAAALGLGDAVLFPGFVPPSELPDWYRAAAGFVYPSLFEGFGLPVLEAMACGTPVLCSAIPSLLEVAGDAALTFPRRTRRRWCMGCSCCWASPGCGLNCAPAA